METRLPRRSEKGDNGGRRFQIRLLSERPGWSLLLQLIVEGLSVSGVPQRQPQFESASKDV